MLEVFAHLGLTSPARAAVQFTDPTYVEQSLVEAHCATVSVRADEATFRFRDLDEYWQYSRNTRHDPCSIAWTRCRPSVPGPCSPSGCALASARTSCNLDATALIAVASR